MKPALATLASVGSYVRSKGVSILVLIIGFAMYNKLTLAGQTVEGPGIPFIELFYSALTILAAVVAAPLVRLLVFNEAAQYAESGALVRDLKGNKGLTPALLHYWFATAICYLVCLACMATITK